MRGSTRPAPGHDDHYLNWLRTAQPHPPEEQAEAVRRAEELMAYVRETWLPEPKMQDGPQTRYFRELDARADQLPPPHLPFFWDNVSYLLHGWFATGAWRRARQAEEKHALPVDADHLIANALLLTGDFGLRGPEQGRHLRWLQEALPPERAHRETARFIEATAARNSLEPPADLVGLVRTATAAAGLGAEENTRLLGVMVRGECAWRAHETLLQDIAEVFAAARPDDEVRLRLLSLFTRTQTKTNGKGLLQVLRKSGAFEAMVSGRLVPEGGCGGWLTGFVDHYSYYWTPNVSLKSQPLPAELYALLPELAGPLKAEGKPVRIHHERGRRGRLDGRLADTCLQLGISVQDPGPGTLLDLPPRRKDDYAHLRADPVLGPRTARVVFRPGGGGLLV
ncbi:hypothetical protein DVA86_07455 [Streptomyces armeniacus]|uniref:Uncharacterized protein n=1 Tax=Streptomyces armeniacus TaxID=83291 RepID=A0A345XLJ7_9ACTN|nr:hypothetical protein [Streptomyces armeniacus]AXK32513.1 hypothetical protein DVA86_07455 [Streptomyces armeniacus]